MKAPTQTTPTQTTSRHPPLVRQAVRCFWNPRLAALLCCLYFGSLFCLYERASSSPQTQPVKQPRQQQLQQQTGKRQAYRPVHGRLHRKEEEELDPTDPRNAVHQSLTEFITVGGVVYRPGAHYNCTKRTGKNVILPRAPTFLIVGVQKGGTSALNALLSQHRRIIRSSYFEPHFFDQHPAIQNKKVQEELHGLAQNTSLAWSFETPPLVCDLREIYIKDCFDFGRVWRFPAMLTYEKTPAYVLTEGAPEMIHTIAPWAKVIISLRNPIDRAFSNFKMMIERTPNQTDSAFEEILAKDLAVLRHNNFSVPDHEPFARITDLDSLGRRLNHRWKFQNYIYRSLYADQLSPWLQQFELGRNLMIVAYERLNAEPEAVLREILEFLQIPDHNFQAEQLAKSYSPHFWRHPKSEGDAQKTAAAVKKLTLHKPTRDYLQRLFQPYNDQLAELLGQDEWRTIWNGTTRY